MTIFKKLVLATLVVAALFSGNARKLMHMASNAIESEALASPDSTGGGGGTCAF